MQNLKKNWSVVSKMTRIWWNLTWAIKTLKNLHFHLFLLCKVFNVWPKKVQRRYLSWHWKVIHNFKKNLLVVSKMTWGIWQIFTIALESLKLGIWWDPLIQIRKSLSWKFKEKLCVMTVKNDAKSEEELTCCFKIDMRNLMNFNPSTWKSQKLLL